MELILINSEIIVQVLVGKTPSRIHLRNTELSTVTDAPDQTTRFVLEPGPNNLHGQSPQLRQAPTRN